MAISFVAAGAYAVNNTVTTQAITAPTLQAGDIMIACVLNRAASVTISAPDGTWNQIVQGTNDPGSGNHVYAIFWKLAAAGDSGASFTFSKSVDDNRTFGGVIGAWRGCLASPLDATAAGITETTSAADNASFPAFNPTSTAVEVIFVAFYSDNDTAFSAAMSADTNPDCTTRWELESATGNQSTIACTSGSNDGSNVAARTWASNSTSDNISTGVVFALVASTIIPIAMRHYRQRRSN